MDIARIGFSADTSDLKDAKASLEALVPAAKRAQNAAAGVSRAAAGLAGGIKPFSNAVQQAATGSTGLSRAALASSTAMGTVQKAAVGASAQIGTLGAAVARTGLNFAQADAHVEAYKRSLAGVAPAAESARSSLQRMGAAANDNINAMQATPGNIAAQFQDIGVTAAAGMNPMIIALQQGTQLSAAMSGGLGNLLRGLRQVFSASTLLTIGIVGLLAAGIQMVDWAEAGAWALNMLADGMDAAAPYAAYLGAALLIAFGPKLLGAVYAATVAIGTWLVGAVKAATLAVIAFSLANPWAAFILGITAVITAMYVLNDTFGGVFSGILKWIKDAANFLIGSFVGAFNTIVRVWEQLPDALGDAAYTAANRVKKELNDLFKIRDTETGKVRSLFNFETAENPYAGALANVGAVAAEEMGRAQGKDYVGGFADSVAEGFRSAAGWMRGLAGGLGAGEDDPTKTKTGRTARGRHQKTNDELFAEVIEGADKALRALQDTSAQIGVYGEALERLKYEQQLFNDAQDKGVVLTAAMTEELKRRAAEMASLAQGNVRDQFMEDMRREHNDAIQDMIRERGEIGLTGEALEAYRIETDLLNQARAKGLTLNEAELAQLRAYAQGQAAVGASIDRTREAYERLQEITKSIHEAQRGFITDFISGLREGESVFRSFMNAMENFANRLLDRGLNMILDMLFTGPGGQSRGIGSILGFAKGGAFSNSIVTEPTLFRFARGAALGEMGEAGPEAIMPLKRGPDGSLGVQSHGGGGTVVNAPVEVNNHYSIQGAVSSADIIGMVRSGSEQTKRDLARQLPALLAQLQRDGTLN